MQKYVLNTYTVGNGSAPAKKTLDGIEYYVLPTVSLRQGIYSGSLGPLKYTADVLAVSVYSWDHLPVVLDHPQDENGNYISARSTSEIEKRKVGIILNSGYSTTQEGLTHELWLDIARTEIKNPKLLKKVEAGGTVEVSTGMLVDLDETPVLDESGEEIAVGTVVGVSADHLAIVTSGPGACSVKDGCGAGAKMATNACGCGGNGGCKCGASPCTCEKPPVGNAAPATVADSLPAEKKGQIVGNRLSIGQSDSAVMVTNSITYDDLMSQLSPQIRERFDAEKVSNYVRDIEIGESGKFAVIFTQYDYNGKAGQDKILRVPFTLEEGKASLSSDVPVEVYLKREWVPVSPATVAGNIVANQESITMSTASQNAPVQKPNITGFMLVNGATVPIYDGNHVVANQGTAPLAPQPAPEVAAPVAAPAAPAAAPVVNHAAQPQQISKADLFRMTANALSGMSAAEIVGSGALPATVVPVFNAALSMVADRRRAAVDSIMKMATNTFSADQLNAMPHDTLMAIAQFASGKGVANAQPQPQVDPFTGMPLRASLADHTGAPGALFSANAGNTDVGEPAEITWEKYGITTQQ